MTAGVTASIALSIRASLAGSADLGTPRAPVNVEELVQFVAGTASDSQANLMFSDIRPLASAASENLDMAGALTGPLGATITAAEVVAIFLKADADNTTNVTVFGAADNEFDGPLGGTTPTLTLKPGDSALLLSRDGWTVTAGTGDLLQVTNGSGAAASYTVVIIGRTAST